MTKDELAAIKERCGRASQGAWRVDKNECGNWVESENPDIDFNVEVYVREDLGDDWKKQQEADTEFIAHARTDVPELVAEVERLNQLIAWWVDRAILPPDSSAEDAKVVFESRKIREALGEE